MSHIYKNITTTDATFLTGRGKLTPTKICIVNTSASYKYSVDLYLYKKTMTDSRREIGDQGNWDALTTEETTYYIIKTVQIPVGATLKLEKKDLLYDFKTYSLYLKVNDITGSGVTVDVSVDLELINTSPYPSSNSGSSMSSGSGTSSGY